MGGWCAGGEGVGGEGGGGGGYLSSELVERHHGDTAGVEPLQLREQRGGDLHMAHAHEHPVLRTI